MFGYSFEYGHYSMGKMQCKLHFRASFSKNPAICVPGNPGLFIWVREKFINNA